MMGWLGLIVSDQMGLGDKPPVRQDVTTCKKKGCDSKIIFVKTPNDKFMPVDAKPERRIVIDENQLARSVTTWTPHWATCTDPDSFR